MKAKEAKEIAVSLSSPSKMPCSGYSIPARHCQTGSKLRLVEGSVCFKCYAFKGNYTFKSVQSALERRFESLNNPQWVEAMVTLITETAEGDRDYFRWHDSGDLQGEKHLGDICEIARRLPNIKFWLPTKEWKLVRDYSANNAIPSNLIIRLSMPRIDQPAPSTPEIEHITYSEVHSKEGTPSNGAFLCPAKNQGNKCLDCRMCWNPENLVTAYPAH